MLHISTEELQQEADSVLSAVRFCSLFLIATESIIAQLELLRRGRNEPLELYEVKLEASNVIKIRLLGCSGAACDAQQLHCCIMLQQLRDLSQHRAVQQYAGSSFSLTLNKYGFAT